MASIIALAWLPWWFITLVWTLLAAGVCFVLGIRSDDDLRHAEAIEESRLRLHHRRYHRYGRCYKPEAHAPSRIAPTLRTPRNG